MQRADNVLRVAATLQHGGLPVAADVGQQLDAVRVAHQHLRLIAQHLIVAEVGYHQFMADIVGAAFEQHALFELQHFGVEIPAEWWLNLERGELIYVSDIGQTHIILACSE
jgi:hypothetical protein